MRVREIVVRDDGQARIQCDVAVFQVEPDGKWQDSVAPSADVKEGVRNALAVLTKAVKAPSHRKKEAAS